MRVHGFEREQRAEAAGGGGSAPAPAVESTVLQDVQSLMAEMESGAGGQASASEHPAPVAAPAAPVAAAAPAAPAVPAAAAPSPAPSTDLVPYTDDELEAFEGNFDRRDFDWKRVPPQLVGYAKRLASGTGKYRSRLEQVVRAELSSSGNTNPQTPAAPATPAAPEQFDSAAALEEFLTPATMFTGLQKILATNQGKQVLSQLGYNDPAERAAVSDLVTGHYLERGLVEAQEYFPALTADPTFTAEVQALISEDPKALAALKTEEASDVFCVASARVVQMRQATREQAFAAREQTLAQRETSLTAREAALTAQIEATNRTETAGTNASVNGGGQQSGANKETTLLDDVRELGPKLGMFQAR